MSDRATVEALAAEVGLRLRRHGVTGEERLVLYDRGDGVGAMPAAQLAELAGHPRVAVLLGGIAAWTGPLETGQVELEKVRVEWHAEPRGAADPRRAARPPRGSGADGPRRPPPRGVHGPRRLGVRPAPGPHPGRAPPRAPAALTATTGCRSRPSSSASSSGCPRARRSSPTATPARARRSATLALRAAGYRARNYAGSWHEWSRHPELPAERGLGRGADALGEAEEVAAETAAERLPLGELPLRLGGASTAAGRPAPPRPGLDLLAR